MPETIPSTFFTDSPHWSWIIVLYFFFGGIAGGSFFLAGLLDLIGRPSDRPLARIGYYVAFPAIVLGTLLLIVDLGRPERFWHMLIQSETFRPMFKSWSPISFGTWAISAFGLLSFLAFLRALAEDGYIHRPGVVSTLARLPWKAIAVVGGLLGLFVAAYTGLVVAVTNRPIWGDTSFVSALFLVSGVSTAAATLLLLGYRNRAVSLASVHRLQRTEALTSLLELVTLAALVISLGAVARVWLSGWGLLLLVGVVGAGILVPLWLHFRPRGDAARSGMMAAALALLGGLLLRVVIVISSEAIPHGG
jgi:protein NrfD